MVKKGPTETDKAEAEKMAGKAVEALTLENFQQLHTDIIDAASDLFGKIPWQLDLVQARKIAAQERKPLYIWGVSGNPFGPT